MAALLGMVPWWPFGIGVTDLFLTFTPKCLVAVHLPSLLFYAYHFPLATSVCTPMSSHLYGLSDPGLTPKPAGEWAMAATRKPKINKLHSPSP